MSEARPLDRAALREHALPPIVDGDKESKGRLLVIAGSRELPGAAVLAAVAAMRSGVGKVRIATVDSIAGAIGTAVLETRVFGLPETDGGGFAGSAVAELAGLACKADAVVAGPGVRENDSCKRIADALLRSNSRVALDAAFLRALEPLPEHERSSPPVLLPHASELAALLDLDEQEIGRDPISHGIRAAQLYRAIVLVKGVTSHVVTPEGDAWTYDGGAPGLGVSGSGDVLAGIVGGLLARGAEPLSALLWAVWLHGEAGAALAKKVGPIGFLAREIAGEVPALLPR
jgi:hydroxyethylthiazole kinase-like uncharacterized protein yjeF